MEQTNRTVGETTETGAPLDPGVYAITNTETGRVLIGSTMNLMAVGNNLKLARSHGITGVLDPRLLADWARFGADAFYVPGAGPPGAGRGLCRTGSADGTDTVTDHVAEKLAEEIAVLVPPAAVCGEARNRYEAHRQEADARCSPCATLSRRPEYLPGYRWRRKRSGSVRKSRVRRT